MAGYDFWGHIEESASSSDGHELIFGLLIFVLVIVVSLVFISMYKIVSHLANVFFIPKLHWFWFNSFVGVILLVFILSCAILLLSRFFGLGGSIIGTIICLVALVALLFFVPMTPVFSGNVASSSFKFNKYVYVLNTELTGEYSIPEGTEFIIVKNKHEKYTGTCKAVFLLNEEFVTVEFEYADGSFSKVEDSANSDIAKELKKIVNNLYREERQAFVNSLTEENVYPKYCDNELDLFFKEEISEKGVILSGTWFDWDYSENSSGYYYFDTKEDYSKFKRIYKKIIKEFNLRCFETTSQLSCNELSCYGGIDKNKF